MVFGTAGSTTNGRVPHPLRSLQRVGYATVGIEIRGIPPFAKSAKDGAPGALSKNISKKGPRNCRSLGCPGFPVESDGFREAHAAFLDESRKRGHLWCRVVGNPGTLGMTKGRATLRWRAVAEHKAFFIPWVGRRPMTTPVGMTRLATVANGSSFLQNIRSGHKVRFVIPTGAYPAFLLRCRRQGRVCDFP